MTPKEKALKLVNIYKDKCIGMEDYWAKECALICVNVILQPFLINYEIREHWIEVKKEIQKL